MAELPNVLLYFAHRKVRGYGLSGDASHVSAPAEDGAGAAGAMRAALADVPLDDVAYVNAHATSTPKGDEVELAAIRSVFQTRIQGGSPPLVSSTKGAMGHLQGAAGAVEAVRKREQLGSADTA